MLFFNQSRMLEHSGGRGMTDRVEGMLSPYRVLDLTDEQGLMCGKLMADMGADVIKIEPPQGSAARDRGPFWHDEPDPEKSLFWFAYNTNKKGITLDLSQPEGQEIFLKLAVGLHPSPSFA
jgi:crotonobetainyl-CoA:carnitine CoA-transferase CaiB-like acyl-CoA transferase